MTLFQENLGYTPSFLLPDLQGYFCSQSAAKIATTIKETQTQLVVHLKSAILDYKKHYNKKRIPGNKIQPSDLVLLSTKNIPVLCHLSQILSPLHWTFPSNGKDWNYCLQTISS
ncbi:hypothetical protein DSO57_1030128 [Entomophthora muscae]|uniref:Uncharacterized protein n=1 Tax=Entomophthora muscae TaxID=34485 RepID=A0ACC2UKX1_9FUNG|nr:hypothetical protein DSO57_1030128 [Entomophthora muscae]